MFFLRRSKLARMNSSSDARERQIIRSWHANAGPWTHAIESGSIASRKRVTNAAIIDVVSMLHPRSLLDVGCGEGWLTRALSPPVPHVCGIDAVPELVAEAARRGRGDFRVHSFADLSNGRVECGPFDAAVCNFSLLGEKSVDSLIPGLLGYLNPSGRLIIQTLHPVAACGDLPYRDGWREGSWSGFSAGFSDPAPWYFRTLQTWLGLPRRCGFELLDCLEPTAPGAPAPASIILICKPSVTRQTPGMEARS